MRGSTAAVLLLLTGSGAQAAPATPEEAQRLTSLLERYVGSGGPGGTSPVKIVPHGESYTATLDVTRMLRALRGLGAEVTAGDIVAELAPQPDGRWRVTVDGLPPVGIVAEGRASSVAFTNYNFDGLFDPALGTFASSTSMSSGSTSHLSGNNPVDVVLAYTGHASGSAKDAGSGAVDTTSLLDSKDIDYRVQRPGPGEKDPPADLGRLKAASLAGSFSLQHAPMVALNELWQFLVAHPSRDALVAAQADLKARLRAAVPLASAVTSDLKLSKIAVESTLGIFGLDEFSEAYGSTAGDGKGRDGFALRFAGLSLPDGLVPEWAAPLVPTSLDLTQSSGPFDVSKALLTAIDAFDLAAKEPFTPDQIAAIRSALGADESTITIAPSHLTSATLSMSVQGQVKVAKPRPSGDVTVTATGLDKTIQAVRAGAGGIEAANQAVVVLMAAKALATAQGPDNYLWKVEFDDAGDVKVNGNSLASTFGEPKPAPLTP